jgi:nucleoside-diphosphate-sugar epimerase
VAEALQKAGHQVIGLARSEVSATKLRQRGIEPHAGNLRDAEGFRDAAARVDAVIHAGSPGDATSAETDNVVLDAVLGALRGRNRPFVYTSGIWVIGNTGDRIADEEIPLQPAALVAWRVACEQRVLASAKYGVRASVLRPAIVFGRSGGIPASFLQSAKERGAVRFVGDGHNRWPTVHVDDLADLYVRTLEKAPPGSIFHGAHADSVRVRDAAMAASEAAGIPGKIESWPLEEARRTLGAYADALVLDQRISAEKARKILGWGPKQTGFLEDLRQGSYFGREDRARKD